MKLVSTSILCDKIKKDDNFLEVYKITTAQATAKQAKYPNANPVIIKSTSDKFILYSIYNFKNIIHGGSKWKLESL